MEKRCDGAADCFNDFDEKNCRMVIPNEQLYRKEYPPLGKDRNIQVLADVTLLDIANVDEIQEAFSVKFSILLQW